jgi:DNA repair exonuclease SbcCD ATPase subunit
LAIVSSKLDNLERATGDYDRKRSECLQQLSERFQQLEQKREANKDRIIALEQAMHTQMAALRGEVGDKILNQEREASKIREQIGFMAGKYGAVVSGAVSLSLLFLKWLFDHHNMAK